MSVSAKGELLNHVPMDYETMDWEAEAKRLMAAFDLKEECHFVSGGICMDFMCRNSGKWPCTSDGAELKCIYTGGDVSSMGYTIETNHAYAEVYFEYNRQLIDHHGDAKEFPVLSRAFNHLGLLTLEVEVALQFNITAHQKLEWELERERLIDHFHKS